MTESVQIIVLSAVFCLAPAAVAVLCRRVKVLGKVGPVLILYLLGLVIGNLGLAGEAMPKVQDVLSSATIPLAIPLMLFGCKLRQGGTRSQVLALVTGLAAVVVTVVGGYLIFGRHIDDGAKIGGMLTGVYTGGTINLAALKAMLGVSDSTYILINSYDMAVSFLYLTFLLSAGIRLFRRLLPARADDAATAATVDESQFREEFRYRELLTRRGLASTAKLVCLSLAVCAVSGGVALLLPDNMFMTVFILLLTTLGIACSFIRRVRETEYGYDTGMYLIYIFCITVASMANLSEFDLAGGAWLLGYLSFIVFGSLTVQALLARLCRIDADTMVIASVSFINSPPFVPMIAGAMKNKNVLVAGLSIGVVGYALGNYLGFAMATLLERL